MIPSFYGIFRICWNILVNPVYSCNQVDLLILLCCRMRSYIFLRISFCRVHYIHVFGFLGLGDDRKKTQGDSSK